MILNKMFRFETFKLAALYKIDLIFTFVYSPEDKSHIDEIYDIIQNNKGNVLFVKLTCSQKTLLGRINSPSRNEFKSKIISGDSLSNLMNVYDLNQSIEEYKSLEIDTEKMIPEEAVEKIIAELDI
ncbi:MAG: hypothetical protein ACYDAO_10145 [Thermoplasmataceae archaeon]